MEEVTLEDLDEIIRALPQTCRKWKDIRYPSAYFETRAKRDYIRVMCEPLYGKTRGQETKPKAYRCDIYPSKSVDGILTHVAKMIIYCEGHSTDIFIRMNNLRKAIEIINICLIPTARFTSKHDINIEESAASSKRRKIDALADRVADPDGDTEEAIESILRDYRIDYIKDFNKSQDRLNDIKIHLDPIFSKSFDEWIDRCIGITPCKHTQAGKIYATVGIYHKYKNATRWSPVKVAQYEKKSALMIKMAEYRRPPQGDSDPDAMA